MTLPVAHIGHFLWIFYILPVIIVVAGVIRSTMRERHRERAESADD
jgi:hypothetical protein